MLPQNKISLSDHRRLIRLFTVRCKAAEKDVSKIERELIKLEGELNKRLQVIESLQSEGVRAQAPPDVLILGRFLVDQRQLAIRYEVEREQYYLEMEKDEIKQCRDRLAQARMHLRRNEEKLNEFISYQLKQKRASARSHERISEDVCSVKVF
jgi:hypothetical protein